MRILWVKAGGMLPLTSGARLRSFNTVSELSRLHDVSVVTTHGPGDDPEALRARLPHCERAASFPHDPAKRGSAGFVLALARSWFSRLPLDLWKWRIPALRDGVADLLARGRFDLCIADAMATMPNLPPRCPVPLVLAEHNVEHMIWK